MVRARLTFIISSETQSLLSDDFKTALTQANSLVQLLITYRTRYHGHLQPSPVTYAAFSGGESSPASSSKSSPPILNDVDMDRSRTGIITALISILQRNVRVRYELDGVEVVRASVTPKYPIRVSAFCSDFGSVFLSTVPALADYASKESRAAAYRLIRHLIIDANSIDRLEQFGLDWYMVR